MTTFAFNGLLYFPLTPYGDDESVDLAAYEAHIRERLTHSPGGIFPACGTGEMHALSVAESSAVVKRTVEVVAGRIPVVAGAGGSVADAIDRGVAAREAGADALLVLPPYLVQGSNEGTLAYVRAVLDAAELPVIFYNRGSAKLPAAAIAELFEDPRIIGVKDGVGDIAAMQEVVLAAGRTGRTDLLFFNGLLTAELSQGAYSGIGVPLYSSAAFAMAPEIANAHYRALENGEVELRTRLLNEFYAPLVRLRDETPGFGVSLIKAGARLRGEAMGSVRPPLTDPSERQVERLREILAAGERVLADIS